MQSTAPGSAICSVRDLGLQVAPGPYDPRRDRRPDKTPTRPSAVEQQRAHGREYPTGLADSRADAELQEGQASCIATLVLGRKSEADEE